MKAFTILIKVNYNSGIQKVTSATAINIKKRDDGIATFMDESQNRKEHNYFFIFQIVVLALLGKASCPKIQPFFKVLKYCTTLTVEEGPSRKYYSALGQSKSNDVERKFLQKFCGLQNQD